MAWLSAPAPHHHLHWIKTNYLFQSIWKSILVIYRPLLLMRCILANSFYFCYCCSAFYSLLSILNSILLNRLSLTFSAHYFNNWALLEIVFLPLSKFDSVCSLFLKAVEKNLFTSIVCRDQQKNLSTVEFVNLGERSCLLSKTCFLMPG